MPRVGRAEALSVVFCARTTATRTRIVRQLGGSFGAAVLAVILVHGLLTHTVPAARAGAFDTAFCWAIGFTALTVVPAFLLPGNLKRDARRRRWG